MKAIKKTIEKIKSLHVSFLCFCLFMTALFSVCAPVRAEQQEGKNGEVLFREAVTLFENGSTDRAVEILRESIRISPDYPEAYDRLGYMLLKKGLADEALGAFRSALDINPRLRTSRTGMGLAYLKKGDLESAEKTLQEALKLNPYPSMTHYALGLVYEKQGNSEKSAHHFKEGIRTYKVGKK